MRTPAIALSRAFSLRVILFVAIAAALTAYGCYRARAEDKGQWNYYRLKRSAEGMVQDGARQHRRRNRKATSVSVVWAFPIRSPMCCEFGWAQARPRRARVHSSNVKIAPGKPDPHGRPTWNFDLIAARQNPHLQTLWRERA